MAVLLWDQVGQKTYEHGVSHTVLFPINADGAYEKGVAWSGVTSISATPEGGDVNDHYADNIKYLSLTSPEKLKAAIEAFTYPDEFAKCDGSYAAATGVTIDQQTRSKFGLVYSTIKGNDTQGDDYSETIHFIYDCLASPSSRQYQTASDTVDPITFSWDVTCGAVSVKDSKPTYHVKVDTRSLGAEKTKKLKDAIYGTASTDPRMLMPDDIIELAKTGSIPAASGSTTSRGPGG